MSFIDAYRFTLFQPLKDTRSTRIYTVDEALALINHWRLETNAISRRRQIAKRARKSKLSKANFACASCNARYVEQKVSPRTMEKNVGSRIVADIESGRQIWWAGNGHMLQCIRCDRKFYPRETNDTKATNPYRAGMIRAPRPVDRRAQAMLRQLLPTKRNADFVPRSFPIDTYPIHLTEPQMHKMLTKHGRQEEAAENRYTMFPNPLYLKIGFSKLMSRLLSVVKYFQDDDRDAIYSYIRNIYTGKKGATLQRPPANAGPSPKRRATNVSHATHKFPYGADVDFLTLDERKTLNVRLTKLMRRLYQEPLMFNSIAARKQGKYSNERRYVMSHRCTGTARLIISPEPGLRPDEMSIPYEIWSSLFEPAQTVHAALYRNPSLLPENMIGQCVARVRDAKCIGLPLEKMKYLAGDFDGDEMTISVASDVGAICEIATLLRSETNMRSQVAQSGIKLHPSHDACYAFTLCVLYPDHDFVVGFDSGVAVWTGNNGGVPSKNQLRTILRRLFPQDLITSAADGSWSIDKVEIRFDPLEVSGEACLTQLLTAVFECYGSHQCHETCARLGQLHTELSIQHCHSVSCETFVQLCEFARPGGLWTSAEQMDHDIKTGLIDCMQQRPIRVEIVSGIKMTSQLLYECISGIEPSAISVLGISQRVCLHTIRGNLFDGVPCALQRKMLERDPGNMIYSQKSVVDLSYKYANITQCVSDCIKNFNNGVSENEKVIAKSLADITHDSDLISFQSLNAHAQTILKINTTM
jgi:hypothetical protein